MVLVPPIQSEDKATTAMHPPIQAFQINRSAQGARARGINLELSVIFTTEQNMASLKADVIHRP